jgi:hypothetical protein
LEPKTVSVQKGKDRQPEQQWIKLAPEELNSGLNDSHGGKGRAQQQEYLALVEDVKYLVGSQHHGLRVHEDR